MNETDTFADKDGLNEEYFDFEDISGTAAACYWTDVQFLPCWMLKVIYMLTVSVCSCRDLVNFLTNLVCLRCDQTMVCNFLLRVA